MSDPFTDRRRFRLGIGLPIELEKGQEISAPLSDFQATTGAHAFWAALEQARAIERMAREAFGAGHVARVRDQAGFAALFDAEAAVVTLLAHSPDQQSVELGAKRVACQDLVALCPARFAGIVDLRGCRTPFAGDCFRRVMLAAKVRDYDGRLGTAATLWAYARTLALVGSERLRFDEAAPRAWKELRSMAASGEKNGG